MITSWREICIFNYSVGRQLVLHLNSANYRVAEVRKYVIFTASKLSFNFENIQMLCNMSLGILVYGELSLLLQMAWRPCSASASVIIRATVGSQYQHQMILDQDLILFKAYRYWRWHTENGQNCRVAHAPWMLGTFSPPMTSTETAI